MRTAFWIFLVVSVTGCTPAVSEQAKFNATSECQNHGGLHQISRTPVPNNTADDVYAECADGKMIILEQGQN